MKSNLDCWKALQAAGYFENHPHYQGCLDVGHNDIDKIERFFALEPSNVVVIIGCGYGREAAHICRQVAVVYGIDVSDGVLAQAVSYLRDGRGVTNFKPVLAERYDAEIPAGIDLVYSTTVMQHLTRDLVHEYLRTLGPKLSDNGRMIIQFMETDHGDQDADIAVYEPSVSWSRDQISVAVDGAGLAVLDIKTEWIRPGCLWHWAHIGRA